MATSSQDGLDPAGAQTPEAFMRLLHEARVASGLSLVEIAERASLRGYDLDPVGLHRALDSPTLPTWETVTGVLTACGMSGMQIDRWIRVYHDLAGPAQRVAFAAAETAILEPIVDDAAPISVPPLLLTAASTDSTTSSTSPRLGRRHFAIAGSALIVLIMVPLLLFALANRDPDTVAAEVTSTAPRTANVAPPMLFPSDLPGAEPSPTASAAPTTSTRATSPKPSPRTSTASPLPSPSPKPPSPAEPAVLRSGNASLSGSGGFDLDSGQTEGERDIRRWNNTTLTRENTGQLQRVSGAPSKQTCQAVQSWQTWVADLQAGQWLCVRTSGGRYARLNITATGSTVKFAYTVWT